MIRLLETVPFEKITVNQLILACRINRSTFYRNYEDKYDLIRKICQEQLDEFQNALRLDFITLPVLNEETGREAFSRCCGILKRTDIYSWFYADTIFPWIWQAVCIGFTVNGCWSRWKSVFYFVCPPQPDFLLCATDHGNILTTILWWHEQQFSATESEMLQIIVTAIQQGFTAVCESLTNY